MNFLCLLFLFGSNSYSVMGAKPTIQNHHKLLLVSMDGFSTDYVKSAEKLPAFKRLFQNSARAEFLRPPFPSLTCTSHVTIATGLYTESHNVVHNHYYDWKNASFGQGDYLSTLKHNEWWDNGYENIFITASKQGLKSAGYLYPGSNATINGFSATRSILQTVDDALNEKELRDRVDDVMKWLVEDEFDFVALYYENPDLDGHEYGPKHEHLYERTIPMLDRALGYLLDKVNEYDIADDLNIILLSDHGMTTVDKSIAKEDTIQLMKYIDDPNLVSFVMGFGPLGLIEPVTGYKQEVYLRLKDKNPHMTVYYREELPERWHYKNSDRIPSIVVVSEPGHLVYNEFTGEHAYSGFHGYDNLFEEMNGIFYAMGPSFKKNLTTEGFDSIHVYPLMCYLLGLDPAPNNGSLEATQQLLNEDVPNPHFQNPNIHAKQEL